MFIFSEKGREAYLDFVRNLPAQIVLLSPCVFLPKAPNFHETEFVGWVLWFGFLCMFFFAAIANFLRFLDAMNCKEPIRAALEKLRADGLSGWCFFFKSFRRVPIEELASFSLVILFTYLGIGTVAVMVFWSVSPKH